MKNLSIRHKEKYTKKINNTIFRKTTSFKTQFFREAKKSFFKSFKELAEIVFIKFCQDKHNVWYHFIRE